MQARARARKLGGQWGEAEDRTSVESRPKVGGDRWKWELSTRTRLRISTKMTPREKMSVGRLNSSPKMISGLMSGEEIVKVSSTVVVERQ